MIIDLERFAAAEKHYWKELATELDRLESDHRQRLDLAQAERLHYLYQRAAADLARLATFSAEPELRRTLSALVARAYAEIQSSGTRYTGGFRLGQWAWQTFPQTFRRHVHAFWLALAITIVGCGFGGVALKLDPEAKEIILPFSHLMGDPNERVAEEEQDRGDRLEGHKTTFSASLMANNIKVSIFAMAMGATWALGTIVVLFYNGVILGAVAFDYLQAGQGVFLAGWLLPHGSVEIPSILLAGQAGLILGGAIIGWGRREPLGKRLREVRGDLVTLISGVALMLVWAGIIEAFFSQYHAPVLPYSFKIAFGSVELALLTLFLTYAGRGSETRASDTK